VKTCTVCSANESDQAAFCRTCGTAFASASAQPTPAPGYPLQPYQGAPQRKYQALRTIALAYKTLAVVAGAVAVLVAIQLVAALSDRPSSAIVSLLMTLGLGAIFVVTLFAASEGIEVVIDIEENTRRVADRLGAP